MKNKGDQRNKTYIIIAVIIGVAVLSYGILNFVSKEKDRQLEQVRYDLKQKQIQEQKAKEQEKQTAKEECLIQAHVAYEKEGAQECVKNGYTENDFHNLKCYLPDHVLQNLLKQQSDWQKSCLETFK